MTVPLQGAGFSKSRKSPVALDGVCSIRSVLPDMQDCAVQIVPWPVNVNDNSYTEDKQPI